MNDSCEGALHPKALKGLKLFNEKKFFEAHEELESAWREEKGKARDLYRGVLQVAVAYLHIERGNYNGAIKVCERSAKWLAEFPDVCMGIQIGKLRNDSENAIRHLRVLGAEKINEFDADWLKPILWSEKKAWLCDRCGNAMEEKNCKITCPNCGNRFDCSDLNVYFD